LAKSLCDPVLLWTVLGVVGSVLLLVLVTILTGAHVVRSDLSKVGARMMSEACDGGFPVGCAVKLAFGLFWCLILSSPVTAQENCSGYMNKQVRKLTHGCMNQIVLFVATLDNGAAVIADSKNDRIYVQLIQQQGTLFAEAVGRKHFPALLQTTTQKLLELGWGLPGPSGNFGAVFDERFIASGDAARHLIWALEAYGKAEGDSVTVDVYETAGRKS
jgi:hypothetical protein